MSMEPDINIWSSRSKEKQAALLYYDIIILYNNRVEQNLKTNWRDEHFSSNQEKIEDKKWIDF